MLTGLLELNNICFATRLAYNVDVNSENVPDVIRKQIEWIEGNNQHPVFYRSLCEDMGKRYWFMACQTGKPLAVPALQLAALRLHDNILTLPNLAADNIYLIMSMFLHGRPEMRETTHNWLKAKIKTPADKLALAEWEFKEGKKDEALSRVHECGDRNREAFYLHEWGKELLLRRQYPAAIEKYNKAKDLMAVDSIERIICQVGLSHALALSGNIDEASAILSKSLPIITQKYGPAHIETKNAQDLLRQCRAGNVSPVVEQLLPAHANIVISSNAPVQVNIQFRFQS